MDSMLELIHKTLKDNGEYCNEVWKDPNLPNVFYITIDGDWKHDHGYIDYLMEGINLHKLGEKDVEENGDDWYESTHIYIAC